MLSKDISFSTPAENILFDDVLLHLAEQGSSPEVLRFWESSEIFIVLGRTGKWEEDVYVDCVCKENIPVLRRSSGGGTVVQGKGCLNFTLVLSKKHHPDIPDLRKSYRFILGKITDALALLGVPAVFKPISDLAVVDGEKKFSGNAQHRGRNFILHHGTILYDFDLPLIEKFLKMPRDVPEYRRNRSHLEFVTNIGLKAVVIKEAIQKIFNVRGQEHSLNARESESLKNFLKNREVTVN